MRYFLLTLLFMPTLAFATPKLINVSGTCQKKAPADSFKLNLQISDQSMAVDASSKKVTREYNVLKEKLEKLKIKSLKISTSNFNIHEVKEWEKEKVVFKGYKVSLGMELNMMDLSEVGKVVVLISEEKVKEVNQMNFYLSDATQKKLRDECLVEATLEAKQKATKISQALEVKLGSVYQISHEASAPPVIVHGRMEMMAMKSADAPQITPSEETVTVTVQASFEIN